ncbi:MAG: hypothetical protein IKJ39_03370 [Lachnospiraceae bacterium]|nr:hypothetical protein [Lachnospiraceae bacterium]
MQNPGRFESFDKLIRVGDLDYVTYQLLTLTVREEIEPFAKRKMLPVIMMRKVWLCLKKV